MAEARGKLTIPVKLNVTVPASGEGDDDNAAKSDAQKTALDYVRDMFVGVGSAAPDGLVFDIQDIATPSNVEWED
jgi:hypothetical protein